MTETLEAPPIGHNHPPEPSPYQAHLANIEDWYAEAKNWLDGEPVASQQQADSISRLMDELRQGKKAADESRKIEAKPFDDGKAEVQARYNPLLAKVDTAVDACKAALKPWLERLEQEKAQSAKAAREAADAAAQQAREAIQAAGSADLGAREQAETLVREAEKAGKAADRAERDKAKATGGTRATTLRSYFSPVLKDGVAAARHYWVTDRQACEGFFISLAETDVRNGKRVIPGFEIVEDRRPV